MLIAKIALLTPKLQIWPLPSAEVQKTNVCNITRGREERKADELSKMLCERLLGGFRARRHPAPPGAGSPVAKKKCSQYLHMPCNFALHSRDAFNALQLMPLHALLALLVRKADDNFPRSSGAEPGRARQQPHRAAWFCVCPPPRPHDASCVGLLYFRTREGAYFWNFGAKKAIFKINVALEGQV